MPTKDITAAVVEAKELELDDVELKAVHQMVVNVIKELKRRGVVSKPSVTDGLSGWFAD